MTYYPKNFDPAVLLGIDGSDPEIGEDEPWATWCSGKDQRFPPEFALFCWWHLADALHAFVTWEGLKVTWPVEYQGCSEQAQARFRKELINRFNQVQMVIGEAWETYPFGFETQIMEFFQDRESGKKLSVQIACAYTIKCLDDGISGLLENNPTKSALGFSYALKGLELVHEYRGTYSGSGEFSAKLARSNLARSGALAKLQTDPKQSEKLFVKECWLAWKKDPDRYKSKAAFSRDMLSKCKYLESQKKIEDWCRQWEATAQPAE